jgi:hypothetical protein
MHVGLHVKCQLLVCGVNQIGVKDKFQLMYSVSNCIKRGSAGLQLLPVYRQTETDDASFVGDPQGSEAPRNLLLNLSLVRRFMLRNSRIDTFNCLLKTT